MNHSVVLQEIGMHTYILLCLIAFANKVNERIDTYQNIS